MKANILILVFVLVLFVGIIFSVSSGIEPMITEEVVVDNIRTNISEEQSIIDATEATYAEEPVIQGLFEEVGECEPPPQYGFTEEDIYLLTQLLCGDESIDGDGEYDFVYNTVTYGETNYREISKVLSVIMNRVRSEKFPDTLMEVLLQPKQFSVFPRNLKTKPAEIAIETVRWWCEAYDRWDIGVQFIPENHLYFSAGPNLTNITRENWR